MIEAVEYLAQFIREQYPDAILERLGGQNVAPRANVRIIYYQQASATQGIEQPVAGGTGSYEMIVPILLRGAAPLDKNALDADIDLALFMQTMTDWLIQMRPVQVETMPTRKAGAVEIPLPAPVFNDLSPERCQPQLGPLTYHGEGNKSFVTYDVNIQVVVTSGTSVYEDPSRHYYIGRDPDPMVEPVPTPVSIHPNVRVSDES